MSEASIDTDLATAIPALYQAPFEEFVSRRDALARALRAEKRRDDAALVKTLRKPSRTAWSLDAVLHEDPASIERLDAAIRDAQSGAELRTALERVKDTVRDVAAAGARAAVRAGHPIDPNALAMAVHAIIGDATAFAEWRAGRLVDVPDGGGLDLLSALAARHSPTPATRTPATRTPATRPATRKTATPAPRAVEPPKVDPRVALAASARAELHRAEKRLADLRKESEHAARSVRDAATELDAAERALAHAQREVEARRHKVEGAERHADSVAETVEEARRAVDTARARVAEFD